MERVDGWIKEVYGSMGVWKGDQHMQIMISGSTGLIGSAVSADLKSAGHRITRLIRDESRQNEHTILWDPESGLIRDPEKLSDMDAVIHFAGSPIFGRWTQRKKSEIRDSRVRGTETLAKAVAAAERKPSVFLSTSGINYYGDRGEEVSTEQTHATDDFLAGVCKDWEAATAPADEAGVRVVSMRMGMVLSPKGGALKVMLRPFQLGLGGRLGSGTQFMSWISIQDVCGIIRHLITNESISGPVNLVSPAPVTNLEFTKTLGRVLSRPTIFPVPAFMVRLILGEMGEALLLASQRVIPARLQQSGYSFVHAELEDALRELLGNR